MLTTTARPSPARIAYTIDGREAQRVEAYQEWQARNKSEFPRNSQHVFSRAEDSDSIGKFARDCLARHGVRVIHLTPTEAVAYANGARLSSVIAMASVATASPAPKQVRP